MSTFLFRSVEFRHKGKGALDRDSSQDGTKLVMAYLVEWRERYPAMAALLGTTTRIGIPANPPTIPNPIQYLSREIPHSVTWEDDVLYCKSVNYKEGGAPRPPVDAEPNNTDAELRVTYEFLPYDVKPDEEMPSLIAGQFYADEGTLERYVSVTTRDKSQILKAKGLSWKWAEGPNLGRVLTENLFLSVKEVELIYVWHQIPYGFIPKSVILENLGKMNKDEFDGYPIGTVVLASYAIQPTRLRNNARAANISYTMLLKPLGANRFPDPNDGWRFREVVGNDGVSKPYPLGSLNALFRPA